MSWTNERLAWIFLQGGVVAISVLNTNLAVLGEDSRVSLWLLGTVNRTADQKIKRKKM